MYGGETDSLENAVARSRQMWKQWDVEAVRVIETKISIVKSAVKERGRRL